MKRQAILIFSHELTPEQERDLKVKWNVGKIVTMPENIQSVWKNMPPELPSLKRYVRPVLTWLIETGFPGDLVLVQGDFGATYIVVSFAVRVGFVPVYSTTKREVEEKTYPDGTVKQERIFNHCIFRKYEY